MERLNVLSNIHVTKGSHQKKREYIRTLDLKEGGGQFENLILKIPMGTCEETSFKFLI